MLFFTLSIARHTGIRHLLLFLALVCNMPARGQEQYIKDLEQKVSRLNNELKYDQSIAAIRNFISTAKSDDDRYYGFLFLSHTYKHVYDDSVALQYLDTALTYGQKTERSDYYLNNITCQRSMLLFDLQKYNAADSVMQLLAANNYKDLSQVDLSMIYIQEGHVLFLREKYKDADARYQLAMETMRVSNPCDLPLAYGRLMLLYAATNQVAKLDSVFELSKRSADDCGIGKYKLYSYEMITQAYRSMGNFEKAYRYLMNFDALAFAYNSQAFRERMTVLDKKYQTKEKEARLLLQGKQIERKNFFIATLVGSFAVTIALILLGFIVRHNRRQKREEALRLQFTRQLLQNIEQERGRIAGELHDGISHELLTLKHSLPKEVDSSPGKIDRIINDIRQISRNLHPVMLDKIGLKPSIETLCEKYMQDERLFVTADITYDKQLNPEGELQLYRIIQEALTNIEKYAGAHAAQIIIEPQNQLLRVTIKDNGKGFDVSETLSNGSAFGLHSIIERSKALGGKAGIASGDSGTTIHIEIPIQHA